MSGVDAAILVAVSGAQQREMQPRKVQTTFLFEA
jgi:hypothetical protein